MPTDYTPDFSASGAGAQLALGLESAYGIPGDTVLAVEFENETLMPDRPLLDNPNMNSSNLDLKPWSLFADTSKAKFKYAPDIETMLRLRLSHRGYYEYNLVTAGVGEYEIRNLFPGDTPVTKYIDSLFIDVYRDDELGHLLYGCKLDEMTLSAVENQFNHLEHSLMFANDTHMGDNAFVFPVGGPYPDFTGKVIPIGHRSDPESADAIKWKCTTPGDLDGTAKVKFTKGATAYGATEHAVYDGKKLRVLLADDSPAGTPEEKEEVYVIFKKAIVGDTLTLNDEGSFSPSRGVNANAVASGSQVLTGVDTEAAIVIDSVTKTYALHQAELKYMRPRKLNTGLGSKYAYGVLDNGKELCTWTLLRDYTDLDFYRAVVNGKVVEINQTITGSKIGATSHYETITNYSQFCRVAQKMNVGSTAALPESITLRAYHVPSEGNPLLLETYKCGVIEADL